MDNEKCRLLIQLYGAKDLLWNSKSPHYHNKSLIQDAWNEIGKIMELPVSDLKKKMTTLQASYRREKSRIAKSLITGSGAHEIYISKWFAFDDFNFMRDKDIPNETADTLSEESEDISTQNETAHNDQETTTSSDIAGNQVQETKHIHNVPKTSEVKKMKRKSNNGEESPMLKKAFQILTRSSSTSSDPYLTYGQHIANELRKYDPRTLVYVKQAINNVIFEADLEKYAHHEGYYTPSYYSPSPLQYPLSPPQPPLPSPQSPLASPQSSLPSPQPPDQSSQNLIASPPPALTLARRPFKPQRVLSPMSTLQPRPESIDESSESDAEQLINAINSFCA